MNYLDAVDSLTPHIIEKMKLAIEVGCWENGDKLTPEQLDSTIQAVMLWQAKNQQPGNDEPFTLNSNGEIINAKPSTKEEPENQTNQSNLIYKSRL